MNKGEIQRMGHLWSRTIVLHLWIGRCAAALAHVVLLPYLVSFCCFAYYPLFVVIYFALLLLIELMSFGHEVVWNKEALILEKDSFAFALFVNIFRVFPFWMKLLNQGYSCSIWKGFFSKYPGLLTSFGIKITKLACERRWLVMEAATCYLWVLKTIELFGEP